MIPLEQPNKDPDFQRIKDDLEKLAQRYSDHGFLFLVNCPEISFAWAWSNTANPKWLAEWLLTQEQKDHPGRN